MCFVCVTAILWNAPPYTVNASAQWSRCGNVKRCQINPVVPPKRKKKVPFFKQLLICWEKKIFRWAANDAEVAGGSTSSFSWGPEREKKSLFI